MILKLKWLRNEIILTFFYELFNHDATKILFI